LLPPPWAEPPGVEALAALALDRAAAGVGMSASYILLLTAFYVDNGKHLPVWRTLPHLVYWLLPARSSSPRSLVRWPATVARGNRSLHAPPDRSWALDLAPLATAGRY
jgi:hypothetical protein